MLHTREPERLTGATLSVALRRTVGARGAKHLEAGPAPTLEDASVGRVPRVARVLALAHKWQSLISSGLVRDQAELARLVGVTRVRVTQVMNLLRLAPDIQQAVLELPRTALKRHDVSALDLTRLAAEPAWFAQRTSWVRMTSTH